MRGTNDAKLLAAAAARDVVRKHRRRSNCRGRSMQLQRHEGEGIAGEPAQKTINGLSTADQNTIDQSIDECVVSQLGVLTE